MLVDDECFPTHHAVKLMIAHWQKRGDNEAVQILNMKYSTYFTKRAEQILASHNIPYLFLPFVSLSVIYYQFSPVFQ